MSPEMETYMQKLAKKKEPATITILPVLQTEHRHGASCECGGEGCGGSEDGCCGG